MPVTQEGQPTFLLNKFETSDLKTAFADTIGKVGTPARTAFYPLPVRKDKVIRSFLELIYDGKSIIISESKDAFIRGCHMVDMGHKSCFFNYFFCFLVFSR
jgi:hypothetical protein